MKQLSELIGKTLTGFDAKKDKLTIFYEGGQLELSTKNVFKTPFAIFDCLATNDFFPCVLKRIDYNPNLIFFYKNDDTESNYFYISVEGISEFVRVDKNSDGKELEIIFKNFNHNYYSLYYYFENDKWRLLELASCEALDKNPILKELDLTNDPKIRMKIITNTLGTGF